ncbi:MAG TPA: MFS transporter [Mycobacteriales bacterium]|nr:MFS transporter [Mycobacteriales bacterium]
MTAGPDAPRARTWLRRFGADTRAWHSSGEFRRLLSSRTVTQAGSMITYVAVPYQVKVLTGSTLAVGAVGAAELVPMIVCGLYGGALADAVDRRRLVLGSEIALTVLTALLALNATLPRPALWPVYALAGLAAAAASLQEPAVDAILPRVVARDQLTGALALSSACSAAGRIGGPALGGLVLTTIGPGAAYWLDVASYLASLAALARMRPVPPPGGATRPSVHGILTGLRYAAAHQELTGTYLVDIAAMVLAMPTALLPFFADTLHAPRYLGLLYAAESLGALAVSVTSGWTSRVTHHGRAVAYAAGGWGLCVAAAGLAGNVWLALACLVAAGAADMLSGLFRSTIWNQVVPDELRGRLAGIELLSYATGPVLGQVRAGGAAAVIGVRPAIVSGGLSCVLAVTALAARLPRFMSYRPDHPGGDPTGPTSPTKPADPPDRAEGTGERCGDLTA